MDTIGTYEQDTSAMGRINAWHFAVNVANDRPVFGGGFRVFSPEKFAVYAPDPDDYHDAHSIYFEVLGEQGWVGLAIFLAFGIGAWRAASSVGRKADLGERPHWTGELCRMVQVSLAGYAVGGAFLGLAYFDLYYNLVAFIVLARATVDEPIANDDGVGATVRARESGRPRPVPSVEAQPDHGA
jgi:probable O-glycosylation ligase (exosortase A-associated)